MNQADAVATTHDFVAYVLDQARGPWVLREKKMFGEYMVYVDDKPILLVCDNQVFVKIVPELATLLADAATGYPYDGAREHYVLDIDNSDLARDVITVLEPITPLPKPRRHKSPDQR